jgi:hypothetical protein
MLVLPSSTSIDHNWHVWHVTVQIISPAALRSGEDKRNLQNKHDDHGNVGVLV